MKLSRKFLEVLYNKSIISECVLENKAFKFKDAELNLHEISIKNLKNVSNLYLNLNSYFIDIYEDKFYLIKNNKIIDSKKILNGDLDFIKFCDEVFNTYINNVEYEK